MIKNLSNGIGLRFRGSYQRLPAESGNETKAVPTFIMPKDTVEFDIGDYNEAYVIRLKSVDPLVNREAVLSATKNILGGKTHREVKERFTGDLLVDFDHERAAVLNYVPPTADMGPGIEYQARERPFWLVRELDADEKSQTRELLNQVLQTAKQMGKRSDFYE